MIPGEVWTTAWERGHLIDKWTVLHRVRKVWLPRHEPKLATCLWQLIYLVKFLTPILAEGYRFISPYVVIGV